MRNGKAEETVNLPHLELFDWAILERAIDGPEGN
jgi:hypothetical protein